MHGRKKGSSSGYTKAKIDKYVKLKNIVLAKHKAKKYNKKTYALSTQMAAINPDFYTLWCYRRCMLEAFFKAKPNEKKSYCDAELKLIERSLGANPKAYGAWHQRQWIINQGVSDIKNELKLCDRYLAKDSRNFHCWNYRRFVVDKAYALGVATRLTELAFTAQKINENFSNYSAWHYRTVLIPRILRDQAAAETPDPEWSDADAVLDREFELVARAFYVDPEDQSGWLYHRWLLGRVVASGPSLPHLGISLGVFGSKSVPSAAGQQSVGGEEKSEENSGGDSSSEEAKASEEVLRARRRRQLEVFSRELKRCKDLQELEPNCKWVLLTVALLISGVEACADAPAAAQSAANAKEMQDIFRRLVVLDPKRRNYYHDVEAQITGAAA